MEKEIKLSILICSLNSRKKMLDRLLYVLEKQKTDEVEILIDVDNGEKIIGKKRNDLLDKAVGRYVCFIDDDDLVSEDYISKIIRAINSDPEPDCIGIEGKITTNGKNPKIFIHSLRYNKWFERNNIYFRNPNHLNPVKREIALKVKFPLKNKGEDFDYSKRLLRYLHIEKYIKGVIYYYMFITNK